jgi:hypothetical protein
MKSSWVKIIGFAFSLFVMKSVVAQTTIEGEGIVCRVETMDVKNDSYDVQFKSLNNNRVKHGSYYLSFNRTAKIEGLKIKTESLSYDMTNEIMIDQSKAGEIAIHDLEKSCILILKKNHRNNDIYLIDMVWYYKKTAPTFFIFEESK